jgi:nucleotide-binding universal stress UspA family protein
MYTMVVGVDGTEASAAAVDWCAEIGPLLGAEVIAVHALLDDAGFPSDQEFRSWCEPLHRAGMTVRRVAQDDDATRLLQQVAAAEQADLVVVGKTHRGELGGFILGSVVETLAYHARRPLVIVPVAASHDQD